jgi:hypothetical protein
MEPEPVLKRPRGGIAEIKPNTDHVQKPWEPIGLLGPMTCSWNKLEFVAAHREQTSVKTPRETDALLQAFATSGGGLACIKRIGLRANVLWSS